MSISIYNAIKSAAVSRITNPDTPCGRITNAPEPGNCSLPIGEGYGGASIARDGAGGGSLHYSIYIDYVFVTYGNFARPLVGAVKGSVRDVALHHVQHVGIERLQRLGKIAGGLRVEGVDAVGEYEVHIVEHSRLSVLSVELALRVSALTDDRY